MINAFWFWFGAIAKEKVCGVKFFLLFWQIVLYCILYNAKKIAKLQTVHD